MARKIPHSPATQFKPGQSGNPKGKPRGAKSMSTVLKELLETETTLEMDDGIKKRLGFKEAIIQSLMKKAKDGDVRAIAEIFDRMEGKPDQKVQAVTDLTVNVKRK